MKNTLLSAVALFAFAGLALAAQPAGKPDAKHEGKHEGKKEEMTKPAAKSEGKDLVDTAISTGMHKTLVEAVKHCGLVETLKSEGPFTLFAPTDDAFKKLPAGTLETLLKPENKKTLTDILTFHVIKGAAVKADKVVTMKESVATVQGQKFVINVKEGKVSIGNKEAMANVIKTDVDCTNGVIHVIDTVLMPAKEEAKKDAAPAKGK